MLQEILLSLSGVPSPIWERLADQRDGKKESLQSYVSEPEQAMLAALSQLSSIHLEVKEATATISAKHPSLVCRAVSSSITNKHLAEFRRRVMDVEASILQQDASHVGAYQIVPLSTLVADFAPWTRRMEWLRKTTYCMKSIKPRGSSVGCTAALIMEYLEAERYTGFRDLELIATQLLVVAQSTWMKSISSWLLYGQLPAFGHADFMVKAGPSEDVFEQHVLNTNHIPNFVTAMSAENILAIGNGVRQVQASHNLSKPGMLHNTPTSLLTTHLAILKALHFPLNSSLLESAVLMINDSISRHALSSLLPHSEVLEFCEVLQSYMLLGRGEFGISLIENAEMRITARQKAHDSNRPVRKLGRVDELSLKDAEFDSILAKTWADLTIYQDQSATEDKVLDKARYYLRLRAVPDGMPNKLLLLNTLLPVPTFLDVEIETNSPLKIFLPRSTTLHYSRISTYLLSIRRSQLRVSRLWKMTTHRRCHPTPLGPPLSATDFGKRACDQRRRREDGRAKQMRNFWSVTSKSLFMLNEFSSYLLGEVIGNSWKHFRTWLTRKELHLDNTSFQASTKSFQEDELGHIRERRSEDIDTGNVIKHDPRTLARAHTLFLEALAPALLLDSDQFISTLKRLLELLDHLIALFTRLAVVWEGLDLQEDDGVMDAFTNLTKDEKDVLSEMDRARQEVDSLLEKLVKDIKDIEKVRSVNDISGGIATVGIGHDLSGNFVPWKARTLDRLIMKLDFIYDKDEKPNELVDDLEYDS